MNQKLLEITHAAQLLRNLIVEQTALVDSPEIKATLEEAKIKFKEVEDMIKQNTTKHTEPANPPYPNMGPNWELPNNGLTGSGVWNNPTSGATCPENQKYLFRGR